MSGPWERDQHGDRDDLSGFGMVNQAPHDGGPGDGTRFDGTRFDGGPGDGRRFDGGRFDGRPHEGGAGEGGPGEAGPEVPDEQALRLLFQGAVAGLEPADGALDQLRRAVPARRARKRQALVGVAAAVVLVGTAVPALVHVASSGGISADKAVNAGHGEQAQGGTGTETGVEGGGSHDATPSPGTTVPSHGEAEGGAAGKPPTPTQSGTGAGTGHATPSTGAPAAQPACEAGQLGISSVATGAPDATGKVYGAFRIANVSGRECVVGGAGTVGFAARGAADGARIAVVAHTSGDPASGLPDPAKEAAKLLLTPDTAYEVRFAWIPSETCPTVTPPSPTPTPTPSTGGAGGTTTGTTSGSTGSGQTDSGASTQLGTDGTPADGSVEVTHTADPGGPVAAATIPNACAGTIYRTGVLETSS
ncbi:hypothetical protein [Streptomyces sp. NPDC090025]|uniref:hypothetical protein n=1 Tax=Streptomyces sp. NPDC090025 TaxID=3365922 RepID=UPI003836C502